MTLIDYIVGMLSPQNSSPPMEPIGVNIQRVTSTYVNHHQWNASWHDYSPKKRWDSPPKAMFVLKQCGIHALLFTTHLGVILNHPN
jgi:hypothetical protein